MATLSWKTATEVNNYGSEIERRIIYANSWIKVGYVQGKGTTNTSSEYSYRDAKLAAGKYEYRLKQIDLGGAFKYLQSTEIEIAIPKAFALRQNYPNPFNPTTTIELTLAKIVTSR